MTVRLVNPDDNCKLLIVNTLLLTSEKVELPNASATLIKACVVKFEGIVQLKLLLLAVTLFAIRVQAPPLLVE